MERKTTLMLFSNIPYLTKNILYGNRLWQRGYFVDSVEIKGEVIQRYV
ncbi:transposase [Vibrio harveyi]